MRLQPVIPVGGVGMLKLRRKTRYDAGFPSVQMRGPEQLFFDQVASLPEVKRVDYPLNGVEAPPVRFNYGFQPSVVPDMSRVEPKRKLQAPQRSLQSQHQKGPKSEYVEIIRKPSRGRAPKRKRANG